jgi:tRNA-dihydrouridine synthase B
MENAAALGYACVMIGRGLLGRPWALSTIAGGAAPENIGRVVLRHLEYVIEYYGARAAVMMFRKHAAWYSAGLPNSAEFRIRVNSITDVDELKAEISKFWGCELNI